MLEKPDIADDAILACLRDDYGLHVAQLEFLPLGADHNTAVYRATSAEAAYFVKLRSGDFNAATVSVPKALHDAGVSQVIAPVGTTGGHRWAEMDTFHVIVYPYIEGTNGFERELTAPNWISFGRALRRIHTAQLPAATTAAIRREAFSSFYRDSVKAFQASIATTTFRDPIAAEFAAFTLEKHSEISALVAQAHRLAAKLANDPPPCILCHADIHVGNLLIAPDDRLYIVDWDTMLLAPKERDLMFAGMGLGPSASTSADQQSALFYEGYGPVEVDPAALAYYRCERIVQDVYEYCQQVLFTEGSSADRLAGLQQFRSQFGPGAVVERAFQSVAALHNPSPRR